MSAGVTVRRELRSGDIGAIIRLHGVLYPREHGLSPNMERHVASAVTAAVERGWPENGAVWIVERDGEFAGSIALTDEGDGLAALRWFLFDPSVRGLGLGRRLVGELVAEAEERGFERIWLETLAILTTAARIYADHGFVCVGERMGPPWGDPDVPYRSYELVLPRGREPSAGRALAGSA
ncbi:MAG TPA: GNAT family N-acetyltransferase [Solirubrobacterales bacterium]